MHVKVRGRTLEPLWVHNQFLRMKVSSGDHLQHVSFQFSPHKSKMYRETFVASALTRMSGSVGRLI